MKICLLRWKHLPFLTPQAQNIGAKINRARPLDGQPVGRALQKCRRSTKRIVFGKCWGKVERANVAVAEGELHGVFPEILDVCDFHCNGVILLSWSPDRMLSRSYISSP